jgi:hypothetical protein
LRGRRLATPAPPLHRFAADNYGSIISLFL